MANKCLGSLLTPNTAYTYPVSVLNAAVLRFALAVVLSGKERREVALDEITD